MKERLGLALCVLRRLLDIPSSRPGDKEGYWSRLSQLFHLAQLTERSGIRVFLNRYHLNHQLDPLKVLEDLYYCILLDLLHHLQGKHEQDSLQRLINHPCCNRYIGEDREGKPRKPEARIDHAMRRNTDLRKAQQFFLKEGMNVPFCVINADSHCPYCLNGANQPHADQTHKDLCSCQKSCQAGDLNDIYARDIFAHFGPISKHLFIRVARKIIIREISKIAQQIQLF